MAGELGELYLRLKRIVRGGVEIRMIDKGGHAEVALVLVTDSCHWTHFKAATLEGALGRAIEKLLHPRRDYIEEDGTVWKAGESSVYCASHISTFLADKRGGC